MTVGIKQFGIMSVKDLHVVQILVIIILFWYGIWSLTDEIIDYIEKTYRIKRWKLYSSIILLMLIIIIIDPYTFEKL